MSIGASTLQLHLQFRLTLVSTVEFPANRNSSSSTNLKDPYYHKHFGSLCQGVYVHVSVLSVFLLAGCSNLSPIVLQISSMGQGRISFLKTNLCF